MSRRFYFLRCYYFCLWPRNYFLQWFIFACVTTITFKTNIFACVAAIILYTNIMFACATSIIFCTTIIGTFQLVAQQTTPFKKCSKVKSRDIQHSILIYQLSYTTYTILPLTWVPQSRLAFGHHKKRRLTDTILSHQGFTLELSDLISNTHWGQIIMLMHVYTVNLRQDIKGWCIRTLARVPVSFYSLLHFFQKWLKLPVHKETLSLFEFIQKGEKVLQFPQVWRQSKEKRRKNLFLSNFCQKTEQKPSISYT